MPPIRPVDPPPARNSLHARWERWDKRWGLVWRAKNDCLHNSDWLELGQRAGYTTGIVSELEERREELLAQLEIPARIPDPPAEMLEQWRRA
ncbi:MAG: hypothetical protein ACRDNG_04190 [Gaiellaceae bacterium]